VMRGDYKITLFVISCGGEFDFITAYCVHLTI
jgi:hypothetical protein